MQIKNIRRNYSSILLLSKVIIVILCGYFIYDKFKGQQFEITQWPDNLKSTIAFIIVLMLVNWGLEALRWKISLENYEPISYKKSIEIVLSGLALNLVLPLTSGDLAARVLPMRDKYQTISAMVLNRGIMLFLTLILGGYGAWTFAGRLLTPSPYLIGFGAIISVCLILFRKRLNKFILYFKKLRSRTSLKIVTISVVRYLIFVVQIFLLLKLFLPFISSDIIFAGIGWIFLIRSVIPVLFGGLGVRETSGIMFFEPLVDDLTLVVAPIFIIWIINIAVPSIIGLIVFLKLKVG